MTDSDEDMLFEEALRLAKRQAASSIDREGVAAAALTDSGHVLLGVWIDAKVDSACLCAETGPVCEAHRSGRRIVASICVRWTEPGEHAVLAACGVCQERLAVFGRTVSIGVADESRRGFTFRSLASLRPWPWWDAVGTADDTPSDT